MPDPHGASDEGLGAELPDLCSAAYSTSFFLLQHEIPPQQVFLSCLESCSTNRKLTLTGTGTADPNLRATIQICGETLKVPNSPPLLLEAWPSGHLPK